MKYTGNLHELDDGPGQSGGTTTIGETDAKETAAIDILQEKVSIIRPSNKPEVNRNPRLSTSAIDELGVEHTPTAPRNWKAKAAATYCSSLPLGKTSISPSLPHQKLDELDEEIYGTTSYPSMPVCHIVESSGPDLRLARTDKENIESAHELALQAKDREVKRAKETLRKFEDKYRRENRASETSIKKAESERDRMGSQHSKALHEKEIQLQQAVDDIGQLKEQHTKALEEKEKGLQHARAKIGQLREELEARNTNKQGHELANLHNEIATLKFRLALAEKPDDEWIKYLPTTTNFYEAAPHLHPDVVSFDRDAKFKEIENRPSRKQTFGKRLSNVRKERGLYPHYLPGKQLMKEQSPVGTAIALVVSSDGEKTLEVEEQDSCDLAESSEAHLSDNDKAMRVFDEMMAVPKNPIPCLVDNQLAWRDGTRVCTSGHVV